MPILSWKKMSFLSYCRSFRRMYSYPPSPGFFETQRADFHYSWLAAAVGEPWAHFDTEKKRQCSSSSNHATLAPKCGIPPSCAEQSSKTPKIRARLNVPAAGGCTISCAKHITGRIWPTVCIDGWSLPNLWTELKALSPPPSVPQEEFPGMFCNEYFGFFA